MIKIRDLNKTFESNGSTITALKDINLDISNGEIFGIIGLSGGQNKELQ